MMTMMCKKAFTVLLGVTAGALTLLPVWGLHHQPEGVNNGEEVSVKTWSAPELTPLSIGPDMAAVVYRMAGVDAEESGAAKMTISRKRIEDEINKVALAELRETIFTEATSGGSRKTNQLAQFTATEDPAATCATADTAGWGGIDQCVEKCGNGGRYYNRVASQEGACLVLCSLAVDACIEKESWAAKTWTSVKDPVMTQYRKDDQSSSLLLLLVLLMVTNLAMEFWDLFKLWSRMLRGESDLLTSQIRLGKLEAKNGRAYLPRRKKGRQFGLYDRNSVGWKEHLGIEKAKADAARRREACDSLAKGLGSAAKDKMAACFKVWKGEGKGEGAPVG